MDDDDAWQRYAPWEGTYRVLQPAPRLSARQRLLLGGLVFAALVAAVWWTVHRVQAQGWTGFPVVWVWVLLHQAWWVFAARRPSGTRVTPAGLAVRSSPVRELTVPWGEVVAVRPAGRFEDHASALLAGGERLVLLGLPADVAEAMAAVTDPEPPRRPGAPARQPSPGDDLDGPFHRGWSRR